MNRIHISDAVRQKALAVEPDEIVAVHPRDLLFVIDKLNELIDAYNREHREISHEELIAFLAD